MRDIALAALAFLFLATAVAFYWYEYRPSHIRELCETEAIDKARQFMGDLTKSIGAEPPKELEGIYSGEQKEQYYVTCMRQHGVAP